MRAQQIYKQALIFVVFWLSAGALSPQQNPGPAASAPLANATIADFKDNAQVQLPGNGFSAPSLGEVLPPESEINTDNGQVLLRLEDGSEVLVHPHTYLLLKQPTPSNWQRVQLLLGRIKAEIQKRVNGAPQFQIGTPSAVISVRGTRFYVEVDQQKTTEVNVEEGVVQLENIRGIGAPVIIQAGSSSRVGVSSAPEPVQPTSQLQQQSGKSSSDGKADSDSIAQGNSNSGDQGNSGQNSQGNSSLSSHGNASNAGGHVNTSSHGNSGNPGSHGNSGTVHTTPPGSRGHGH